MKRSETSPNRKAFPKFLKWLLISAVFGFCVGIASGILDDLDVGVWLTDGLIRLLTVIAPWGNSHQLRSTAGQLPVALPLRKIVV